jgi:hypothetical protein
MAPPKGHPRYGGRVKGTLNKATASVKEIAGQYTDAAIKTLAAIMDDPTQPSAARVAAAGQLLDRGHGRAHQSQDLTVTQQQHYVIAPEVADRQEWDRICAENRAKLTAPTPTPEPSMPAVPKQKSPLN